MSSTGQKKFLVLIVFIRNSEETSEIHIDWTEREGETEKKGREEKERGGGSRLKKTV